MTDMNIVERVVVAGDLSKLTPNERVAYYRAVCESLGLNPLTRPFDYITLNGRLVLYARKDATDQLRKLHKVSIEPPQIQYADDLILVTVVAKDAEGRTDSELGAVSLAGLKGVDKANAIMKAITKAKRRVTLSIVGLGWLDETEVETIPEAKPAAVNVETGEVVQLPKPTEPELPKHDETKTGIQTWPEALRKRFYARWGEAGLSRDDITKIAYQAYGVEHMRDCTLTPQRAMEIQDIVLYGIAHGLTVGAMEAALEVAPIAAFQGTVAEAIHRMDEFMAEMSKGVDFRAVDVKQVEELPY